MLPYVTHVTIYDTCGHMWKVWPHVINVTILDNGAFWHDGHFGHDGNLDITEKHILKILSLEHKKNIWNIAGNWYLRTFPSSASMPSQGIMLPSIMLPSGSKITICPFWSLIILTRGQWPLWPAAMLAVDNLAINDQILYLTTSECIGEVISVSMAWFLTKENE